MSLPLLRATLNHVVERPPIGSDCVGREVVYIEKGLL
jgi:hypothetical protein